MTEKPLNLKQQAEKETNLEMLNNHLEEIKICQELIIFSTNREYSEILIHGVIMAQIASKNFQKSSFESAVKLPTNYVTANHGVV